jgi:hypothetical protein
MRNIALLRKGKNTSFYNKTHTIETRIKISLKRCSLVKVEDKKLDKTYIFSGFMAAANHLNIGLSTLRRYRKLSSLIKGRYLVSTIN